MRQPAAPSSTAASTPEDASSTLLALPKLVLAQHLWPRLSPWGQAQLRLTCKELRELADGLLDTLDIVATPAQNHSQPQQPQAAAVAQQAAAAVVPDAVLALRVRCWLAAQPCVQCG